MKKEIRRQIIHFMVGVLALVILLYFGRFPTIAAMFMLLIVASIFVNMRLLKMKLHIVEWAEEQFERTGVLFPGWGAASYLTGMLIALTFLPDVNQIAASIFILAVGDSLSTIIGKRGKIRLPHNNNKTLEGSLAFFLSSLPAYYFVGVLIVPLALITAIVESMSFEIDDNLTVPVVCTVFFLVL